MSTDGRFLSMLVGASIRIEMARQTQQTIAKHVVERKVPLNVLEKFQATLASAKDERPLQKFIEQFPSMLVQHVRAGGERWVIPQKRLGAEYVPDFLIGWRSSAGVEWQAVELESPRAPLFTKAGEQSAQLRHAIRQVSDWRSWLLRNNAYASTPVEQSGLGLAEIRSDVEGLIIIGRRENSDPKWNDRRKQIMSELQIRIHTYDWLHETVADRLAILKAAKRQTK